MSPKSRWLLIALSTPLVIIAAVGGLLGASPAVPQKGFAALTVFQNVLELVNGAYVQEVDPDKVMEGAMRGLVQSLDPSSAYLPVAETTLVENHTPLAPGDTGLMVTRQFYLRVLGVRDDSPAAKAGLRAGDFVRAIDDTPTRDMSAFTGTRMLHGAVGSTVKLLIIRGNAAEPHEVTLTRTAPVYGATLSRPTGSAAAVVRIKGFEPGLADALRTQLAEARTGGAKAVVLDVRGVADGSYDEAIKAAEVFIAAGPVAMRAGKDANNKETITAPGGAAVTLPVVVLQSFGTSGPAEVFIAALKGRANAQLVGEQTAGLAAEQHLVKLPQGYGLWMTYRRYFAFDGQQILERGLKPDVFVEEPSVDYGEPAPANDVMLAKALDRASSVAK